MADPIKIPFSVSSFGRFVKVVANASPGTLIHTAHATLTDEIWMWASNPDTLDYEVTVEHGGTTNPDDRVTLVVPFKGGLIPVIRGLPLSNSLLVRAFGSTANKIILGGFVLRF